MPENYNYTANHFKDSFKYLYRLGVSIEEEICTLERNIKAIQKNIDDIFSRIEGIKEIRHCIPRNFFTKKIIENLDRAIKDKQDYVVEVLIVKKDRSQKELDEKRKDKQIKDLEKQLQTKKKASKETKKNKKKSKK